jgi:exonuclease SbcD
MAAPVRVMHFADTHFGVELYGRLDPETGLNTRLKDFKRTLLHAIDLALDHGVDLAVFAGDAYKARDPRQTDQREFADCIRRLTDRGIPVVLLAGNHDMPAIRGRAHAVEIYQTLGVSNVHVLSRPESMVITTGAGPVRVAALPYLVKGYSVPRDEFHGKSLAESRLLLEDRYVDWARRLAEGIREESNNIPSILLGHFWVEGARLSEWQEGYLSPNEPRVPLTSLTDPAFDYVALGHIHKHQDLHPEGHPHVVYSGSPDRIDFGERAETKGFVMVDLAKGNTSYEFIPLPGGRPMVDIKVNADTADPMPQILGAIKGESLRNAIVRLTYTVSQAHMGMIREAEIREALAGAFMTVSVNRVVERDSIARNALLTESRSPREALALYIDSRPDWHSRKEALMALAEPMFQTLAEEEAGR